MKSFLFGLVLLTLVAGCDSPAPAFQRGTARVVDVDDSRFRVFMQHGSTNIEAHRISLEPLPSLVKTLEKAFRAIELSTGCHVVPGSMSGDQAIILAEVDCVFS